jgi:hypothetical protein
MHCTTKRDASEFVNEPSLAKPKRKQTLAKKIPLTVRRGCESDRKVHREFCLGLICSKGVSPDYRIHRGAGCLLSLPRQTPAHESPLV